MGARQPSRIVVAAVAAAFMSAGVASAQEKCAFTAPKVLEQPQPGPSAAKSSPPSETSTPQSFTLKEDTMTLEDGATQGNATLVLVGEAKASPATLTVNNVRDLGLPCPPEVTIDMRAIPLDDGSNTADQIWLIAANVKGLPENANQSRRLALSSGGRTFALPYTLTNKPKDTFSWTVKAPPAEIQVAAGGEPIPVVVAVGPVRATNVRLVDATLIEKSRKTSFDSGGMRLCLDRDSNKPCDDQGLTLAANVVHQLWLRPAGPTRDAGQFTGQLTLVSSQKPDGNPFPLTIDVSPSWAWAAGVLAIFAGVLVSFFVTRYSRNLLNRDQLLLPARMIKEDLRRLQSQLDKQDWKDMRKFISKCPQQIAVWLDQLDENRLTKEQLVPSALPLPWTAAPSKAEEFRQLLQNAADWTAAIRTIVQQGFEEAFKFQSSAPKEAYRQAIEGLDQLATPADGNKHLSPGDLQKQIDAKIQTLRAAIPKEMQQAVAAQAPAPGPSRQQTSTQLIVQITQISVLTWALMMIATVVLGWYVLIRPNLGFGLPEDYVLCFLWGLGIPLGAQQLAQTSSVGTALGVSTPTT